VPGDEAAWVLRDVARIISAAGRTDPTAQWMAVVASVASLARAVAELRRAQERHGQAVAALRAEEHLLALHRAAVPAAMATGEGRPLRPRNANSGDVTTGCDRHDLGRLPPDLAQGPGCRRRSHDEDGEDMEHQHPEEHLARQFTQTMTVAVQVAEMAVRIRAAAWTGGVPGPGTRRGRLRAERQEMYAADRSRFSGRSTVRG
jgi:hypothetical protein